MNKHQQHLYDLLKEIDAFCKKHDVTYYCAGGTVIGAARHGGFIPWDDDIDIYMKRDQFAKFVDAFNEDPIPYRCVEYYEREHQHHSVVNRYQETNSTMMCHYHITGYACAGTLIDVFVLDPIPDDPEERLDYLTKFWALSDLVSPALSYSHRLPADRLDFYGQYEKRIESEGIPALVGELSGEIYRYDAADCRDYCLRWGSIPLIYPVEAIGEPSYLPFEDMEVPVPHDWYRYLQVHYGCNWVQLPYVETRRLHINIVRDDVPYTYFYEKRDEMYSQEQLMKEHFDRKHAHIELSKAERPLEEWTLRLKSRLCLAAIEKNMEEAGLKVGEAGRSEITRRLFEEKRYKEITEIYRPYTAQQTQLSYMGERMHHGGQYRWFFPAFIELEESEIDALMQSLLRTGDVRLCEKLAGIYERGARKSDAVLRAQQVMDAMNLAAGHYYLGRYDECLEVIASYDGAEAYPWFMDHFWLASAAKGLDDKKAAELKALAEAAMRGDETFCSRDALLKSLGDHLRAVGRADEAAEVYRELMKSCRNGMFYNEISAAGVEIPAIPIEKKTEYTGNDITALMDEMIGEIADICSSNGIRYCLSPALAERLVAEGNPGFDYKNREIWMDAASASKFMEAAKTALPEGRKLLCWDNDPRINDFRMLYTDCGSVYCELTCPDRWKGIGTYISIRILRSDAASEKHKNAVKDTEFRIAMLQAEDAEMHRITGSGKKNALYKALRILHSGSRFDAYCRDFFRKSLNSESASGGPYYYYVNRPGLMPLRTDAGRGAEDTAVIEWNGRSVSIPASALGAVSREDDPGNIPPRESLYIYRDTKNSWDDILPLMDMDGFEKVDLKAYGRNRRDALRLDRLVDGRWFSILALDEEEQPETN